MPLEILSGFTTDVSGVKTRVTMFTDDSNIIRTGIKTEDIYLLAIWSGSEGSEGVGEIKSPRMHDNVNGIQYSIAQGGDVGVPLFPNLQRLITQDNLNIFMTTNVGLNAYANVHMLIYYDDLPASQGNYINYEQLLQSKNQIMTLKHSITPDSHVNYSGGEVVTTDQDQFESLKNYAFLGFKNIASINGSALCLRGHDTGNLRIGQPINSSQRENMRPYFVDLAKESKLAVIPLINAANKDNTFIDMASQSTFEASSFYSYWLMMD